MAATLTKTMLSDMMKGNAAISLLACPDSGEVTLGSLDFSEADQIFTVKDSFSISEGDPTTENTQIDQMDEIIDSQITEGDYSMTGQVPSNATALFDYFYEAGKAVAANAVMIGAVAAMKDFPLLKEDLLEALKAQVPAKFLELNVKAFELGYNAVKN